MRAQSDPVGVEPFFAFKAGALQCFCMCDSSAPGLAAHELIFEDGQALVQPKLERLPTSGRNQVDDCSMNGLQEVAAVKPHLTEDSPLAALPVDAVSKVPPAEDRIVDDPAVAQQAETETLETVSKSEPQEADVDAVPPFSGNWALVRIEGDMDGFLREMGWNFSMRNISRAMGYGVGKSTEQLVVTRDTLQRTSSNPLRTRTSTLRLDGSKQGDQDPLGNEVVVEPYWEGDVLVANSWKPNSQELLCKFTRHLEGKAMIVKFITKSGKTIQRCFERV